MNVWFETSTTSNDTANVLFITTTNLPEEPPAEACGRLAPLPRTPPALSGYYALEIPR